MMIQGLEVRSGVKSGLGGNHGLKVRSGAKSGGAPLTNHGLKVRSGVRSGGDSWGRG